MVYNIRQTGTNTPAYYDTELITAVKSYIVLAHGLLHSPGLVGREGVEEVDRTSND